MTSHAVRTEMTHLQSKMRFNNLLYILNGRCGLTKLISGLSHIIFLICKYKSDFFIVICKQVWAKLNTGGLVENSVWLNELFNRIKPDKLFSDSIKVIAMIDCLFHDKLLTNHTRSCSLFLQFDLHPTGFFISMLHVLTLGCTHHCFLRIFLFLGPN